MFPGKLPIAVESCSPYMVPDSEKSYIGLEYLRNEEKDLGAETDDEFVLIGTLELKSSGCLGPRRPQPGP